jgi:two-component system, NarL family, response regulator DegU
MRVDGATYCILVVDDHPVITEGIRALFEKDELSHVSSLEDFRRTAAFITEHEPDAVLFDLTMPNFQLDRDFTHLRDKFPETVFIAYTADAAESTITRCRRLGFNGFIGKGESFASVRAKVLKIILGDEIFPETKVAASGKDAPLTEMHQNILRLLADGAKTDEIAKTLGVRAVTIDYHKRNIRTMLCANTSAEAVAIATQNGWI